MKLGTILQVADPTFLRVSPLSPDFLQRQVLHLSLTPLCQFAWCFLLFQNLTLFGSAKRLPVEKLRNPAGLWAQQLSAQKVPNLGFEFEVATFERTACVGVGSWTPEASWYPGYLWKACVCPKCRWEYKTKMKIWVVQTKRRSLWTEWFKLKHDWKLFLEQIDAKKVFDTLHVCHKFQTKIVFDDCLS